jgi:transposase
MRLNEACAMVGVNYRSAVRWLRWYRREGLESMLGRTPGRATTGRRPKLTSQQSSALLERYDAGQLRTLDEAVAWVREQFGVAYSPSGMCILLRRERARLGHGE